MCSAQLPPVGRPLNVRAESEHSQLVMYLCRIVCVLCTCWCIANMYRRERGDVTRIIYQDSCYISSDGPQCTTTYSYAAPAHSQMTPIIGPAMLLKLGQPA